MSDKPKDTLEKLAEEFAERNPRALPIAAYKCGYITAKHARDAEVEDLQIRRADLVGAGREISKLRAELAEAQAQTKALAAALEHYVHPNNYEGLPDPAEIAREALAKLKSLEGPSKDQP